MLAACGAGREEAKFAALEAGIAQARASLAAISSGASSAQPLPSSSGGGGSGRGGVPAPFRLVNAAPPLAASGLIGADPEALRRWFGEPDLRRLEGEGEVRLYLGPGCALDLVLYASRVAHALARADGAAAVTEAGSPKGIGSGIRGVGRDAVAAHSGGW